MVSYRSKRNLSIVIIAFMFFNLIGTAHPWIIQSVQGAPDPSVSSVVASPAAGTYAEMKSVTLSSSTVGAQLYYKFKGEADSAFRLYAAPVSIAASATIVAKAVYEGAESELAEHAYVIDPFDPSKSLLISNTEQFTSWSNTTPTTTQAVYGTYSGKWTNPATAIATPKFTVPWKSYQQLEFWMYSEQASNKKVYIIIDVNIPTTASFDYFMTSFNVDWTGWKKVVLPFSSFTKSTPQADFDNFNKIMFHPNWFTATDPTPSDQDVIYIDGLALGDKIVLPPIQPVTASPKAGLYAETRAITLSSSIPGAQIYYKYEGEPDSAYRLYTSPIEILESKTIVTKAIHGEQESEVVSYAYTIDLSSSSSVPISHMETFANWSNTLSTTDQFVLGERSGLWSDPTKAINATGFDADWKAYDQVEFWLYSEKASNKKVYFILETNIATTTGFDYFMYTFNVDWSGWKKVEIPYSKFLNSTGYSDFDNFNQIIIHPNWFTSSDPAPDSTDKLYFDGLALTKNVVEPSINVIQQSALPGSSVNYNVSLKNVGEEPTAYQIVKGEEFKPGYTATYDNVSDLVEVGEETNISFTVQVPANAAAGDTAKGTYFVRPVEGGKEIKLELNVAVGESRIPTKTHPYIMTTAENLLDSKEKIESYDWASDYLEAVKRKADDWVEKTIYYPTQPAGQTFWYVCGDVTLTYDYDSPNEHLCPTDGEMYTGPQLDAGWRFTTHTMNTEAARTLGIVYALTGEEKYAEKAREILVEYSKLYPSFPVQAQYGKLFYQTLDEAVQMIQLVQAYDLIYPSGVLTPEEVFGIEQNLFAASAKTLKGYDVGKSNWQTWHNAAIGAIGAALEDVSLMEHSVNGRSGFTFQMNNSVLEDGFWYEGAIAYHFYSQMALFAHAQALDNMGYDLFANPNLKKTYDATLTYAYPDLGIINSNDSSKYPTSLAAPGRVVPIDYEGVYGEYNDPIYGALLNKLYDELDRPRGGHILPGNTNSGIAGEQAVFYGQPEITNIGVLPTESVNFKGLGHSVIRIGEGNEQLFALVDYGLHGGYHGHPDKLHLDIFGQGARLAPDPGIPLYSNTMYEKYYKKTFSHNTVVVDKKTQEIQPSNAETYEPSKLYLTSDRFGIMTNSALQANKNMKKFERTVAVTPDYMIDLFTVDSDTERTYDWVMRGLGSFETETPMMNIAAPLGTEDAYPYFRNGKEAQVTGVWEGEWKNNAGKGLKMFSLSSTVDAPTTMIVGESIGPANDTNAYTPTVVNRVVAKNAQFVSVLEPFSGVSQIDSVNRINSSTIEVNLIDQRKHMFVYHSNAASAGSLQYAWIEGEDFDASDVIVASSIDGTNVEITLNEVVGVGRLTAVVYAPGAAVVSLNGEEVAFTLQDGYVMIQSEVDFEEEPTTPTSTPTPTPTPSNGSGVISTPAPTPTPVPTSTVKPTSTPKPTALPEMKDIATHWAQTEIEQAIQAGIVQGHGDGSFRPDDSVSREQFIVMLIRALKPDEGTDKEWSFSDDQQIASWAQSSVKLALEMDWIGGYEDGTFRPQQSLNRAQLAVVVAKALGLPYSVESHAGYTDIHQIPTWALPAVNLLYEHGIMTGRSGNQFAAVEEVSRAEAVTVILRMLKLKEQLETVESDE
ncbi:S-layer homology domain-containing protein [Paenibacillus sp. strain BS8-2]